MKKAGEYGRKEIFRTSKHRNLHLKCTQIKGMICLKEND